MNDQDFTVALAQLAQGDVAAYLNADVESGGEEIQKLYLSWWDKTKGGVKPPEPKYGQAAPTPASEPLPLFSKMKNSEPFPVDALGPILGPATLAIANKAQIAPAIAAQSVLATASLVASAYADVASTWKGAMFP